MGGMFFSSGVILVRACGMGISLAVTSPLEVEERVTMVCPLILLVADLDLPWFAIVLTTTRALSHKRRQLYSYNLEPRPNEELGPDPKSPIQ